MPVNALEARGLQFYRPNLALCMSLHKPQAKDIFCSFKWLENLKSDIFVMQENYMKFKFLLQINTAYWNAETLFHIYII